MRSALLTLFIGSLLVAFVAAAAAVYPPPHGPYEYSGSTYALLVPLAQSASGIIDPNTLEVVSISQLGAGAPENKKQSTVVGAEIISSPSYETVGWDFVQVVANQTMVHNIDDKGVNAYYYAGFLEGYVTHQRVGQAIIGQAPYAGLPDSAVEWVHQHLSYMEQKVQYNTLHGYASPFWTQVGNLLSQVRGIQEGYMRALIDKGLIGAQNYPNQTFFDLFMLNFDSETGDVVQANNTKPRKVTQEHCSALVRVTDDDIFFSHITWGHYITMLRQFKVYVFQTTVTMSSYPGMVASGDDWYTTSNNLTIQETTNGNYNNTLATLYVVPNTVSEFLRVMVGTYLATTGLEWVTYFETENSGTYCNQYMVVNYNLYTPGQTGNALQDGLLWVAEQIPGNVTSKDVTFVLRETSYWASFNLPYFENIYNISGFRELYDQFGDYFSYTKYARPEIFKRDVPKVKDLQGMQTIMRYNDWLHDNLSYIPNCPYCAPRGNPWLTIAARGDLANVTAGTRLPNNTDYADFFGNVPMGAIDAKITSGAMLANGMQGSVICGPTTSNGLPEFDYDLQYPGQRPPGVANKYGFPWVFFNTVQGTSVPPPPGSSGSSSKTGIIAGVCVGVPVGIVLIVLVVRHFRNKNREEDYVPI